jgi:hypothetical protein
VSLSRYQGEQLTLLQCKAENKHFEIVATGWLVQIALYLAISRYCIPHTI